MQKERPELVATVAWAAGNGDRSENGDYIYGKKRLREIDRRIRFLIKRLDAAEVVDPAARARRRLADQVFFGATVDRARRARTASAPSASSASTRSTRRAATSAGSRRWRARCSRRAKATRSTLHTPGGVEELEIVEVRYEPLATGDAKRDGRRLTPRAR